MDTIRIGSGATYRSVRGIRGFGVWCKTLPDGKESWIIGKYPEMTTVGAVPSSVLQEFSTLAEAAAALKRWSLDQPLPKAPPKVRQKLGSLRRNGNRPRPEKVNPDQLGLEL